MRTAPDGLLVLGDPGEPSLRGLAEAVPGGRVTVTRDPAEASRAAPDAEVIVCAVGSTGVAAALQAAWPHAHRVRWVHSLATGVDWLLFPALVESEVPLTNSRGAFSASLGEFALAGLLFFAKDLRRMVEGQRARTWDPFDVEMLEGRTLAVVGYGDIGRAIARRARGCGMRVVGVSRRGGGADPEGMAEAIVPVAGLVEAIAGADHVAVATPLTPGTRHLVGEAALRAMRPHGVIVNVGRGAVVDERALLDALRARRIRGAALDVFEQEPLPAEHPLWDLDNVLVSPHSADHTAGWREGAVAGFLLNLGRYLRGEPLENVVDKGLGY